MTFPTLLFAYLLSQFFRAFLAVMAGDLTRDLGLDAASLGSLQAAWLFSFALVQFPVGYALDRLGPRRTLAAGMACAVAGSLLLAGASTYAGCLAAMSLIGIGCGPVLMAAIYIAARLYPVERFATISSLMLGLGSLGDPLSGIPLAFVNGALGWRVTMLGMAAITAACAATTWFGVSDPPTVETRRTSFLGGFVAIARLRPLWLILPVTFTSYAVTIATRGLWVAPYTAEVQGLDHAETSFVATAMGFAMAAGALAYAPLTGWIGGPKPTVIAGVAACAAACLGLALIGPGHAAIAIALVLALGACGTSYAIIMAHARSFMPAHIVGRGVTLMNFVFMSGAAALQWMSGYAVGVAQSAGLPPDATYGRLFGAFAVLLAIALAAYLFAPTAASTERTLTPAHGR